MVVKVYFMVLVFGWCWVASCNWEEPRAGFDSGQLYFSIIFRGAGDWTPPVRAAFIATGAEGRATCASLFLPILSGELFLDQIRKDGMRLQQSKRDRCAFNSVMPPPLFEGQQ
jgi:hypothetical protein